ncbi:MAG TPA: BatD family protein [Elusimicrobiales bacterium]|nr:BatD family protein [Elusimicrobiales bacterium]
MKPAKALLALFLLLLSAPVRAGLTVAASVDRHEVDIDGSVRLTVTVSGDTANVPEPEIPRLDAFNVYSSGRSQNISFINGRVSSSVSFTYVLEPRYIGKAVIPPISVFTGKEKFLTRQIEIEVRGTSKRPQPQPRPRPAPRPGAPAAPPAGQGAQGSSGGTKVPQGAEEAPIFMVVEADKDSAYVNEQVTMSVKFFTSVPLTSNPQYVPPSLKGLLAEDLPPVRTGETALKGRRYSYSEIRTALFGLQDGQAVIGRSKIIAQITGDTFLDPMDPSFFQKFFSMSMGQGRAHEVTSEPLSLRILPLPEGAPPGFKGAVGNYIVSASVDRKELKAGEALTLSVSVSGRGHLNTVTAPDLPATGDFRYYDTASSYSLTKHDDIVGGKKVFTTVMIPRSEGRQVIPPVKFSFFDPGTKRYHTAETKPIEINVLKGDPSARAYSFVGANGGGGEIKPISSDIRYLSRREGSPVPARLALLLTAFPAHNAVPLLFLLGALGYARLRDGALADPRRLRWRRAFKAAMKRRDEALGAIAAGDNPRAVGVLYDALTRYLSDKSGDDIESFTLRRTIEHVRRRFPATGEFSLGEIRTLWEQLEFYHFSSSSITKENATDLLSKYTVLLEILEKEFDGK